MAYTYHDLRAKSVADLREIAKSLGDATVSGYTQLNKAHLLPALCAALGVDTHEHHEVKGIDKHTVKAQMRALKADRATALEAHDHDRLKAIRRQLHRLNHRIRAASVSH
jgi:hypothetical protein